MLAGNVVSSRQQMGLDITKDTLSAFFFTCTSHPFVWRARYFLSAGGLHGMPYHSNRLPHHVVKECKRLWSGLRTVSWRCGICGVWQVSDSVTYNRLQESKSFLKHDSGVLVGDRQVSEYAQSAYFWYKLRLRHMIITVWHIQLLGCASCTQDLFL